MRFTQLELHNWRSFRGHHCIEFASAKERNVSLLVGQNGSGKTALLNAFTWVLFEETTAGFRQSGDLFNHIALAELDPGNRDTLSVSLSFDHDGASYIITRYVDVEWSPEDSSPSLSPPKLSATRKRRGVTEAIGQDDINAVLPPGLHPFFFFPAENIGKDIDQNDSSSIRASMSKAIDVLLGIERYDSALKIISTTLTTHLKVPKSAVKDEEIDRAEQKMQLARDEWDSAERRRKELPDLIETSKRLTEDLQRKLEQTDKFQEAIAEFEALKRDIKLAQEGIESKRRDQIAALNRKSAVLFGHEVFAQAKEVLDSAHERGEIPPKISAGLLEELIERRETCICGREIGHEEVEELQSCLTRTLADRVAEVASHLRGVIPQFIESEDGRVDTHAVNRILSLEGQVVSARARLAKLEARRMVLVGQEPEVSMSDQAKIREAWQQQQRILLDLQQELKDLTARLPAIEQKKTATELAYQKALQKHAKANAIGKARGMLSAVEATLTKIQASVRTSARLDVERAMNDFYTPLLLKNYRVRLTDDFHQRIADDLTGKDVGASSSEVALATFAFVGALAALMPVYSRLEQLLPADDGRSVGSLRADSENAYPVVLDAPFSPFGKDYAQDFSDALPQLLPQSILIVREDQLGYLDTMLRERRIGVAYVLQLCSGHTETKTLSWCGEDYGYVLGVDGDEPAHTQILPLPVEN